MSRLARFERYRFIGDRTTMRVYDCDDSDQYETIEAAVVGGAMTQSLQMQSFAPDTLEEARNRGFRPV
jgi:hypothetical protein